jgi:Flp pilus assembly pilin Flp
MASERVRPMRRSRTPDRSASTRRRGSERRRTSRRGRLGQGVVEYGLILSLSALLAIVLLVFFGGTLSAFLQAVGDAIDAAT